MESTKRNSYDSLISTTTTTTTATTIVEATAITTVAASNATTVIKYEKTSCLFCNDWFDSQTFTEHLIHCGQVLEECPNKCNAYITRIKMRTHIKECPRAKQINLKTEYMDQYLEKRLQLFENEINTLRTVLNEEIRQRLHLITDVGNIRKQNQLQDEWFHGTDDAVAKLKKHLNEEQIERCVEMEQCQQDFRYCYDIVQALKNELKYNIKQLEESIQRNSTDLMDNMNNVNDTLYNLEQSLLIHEKNYSEKLFELENSLQNVKNDIQMMLNGQLEYNKKQAILDVEVKNMKCTAYETEERCEKLTVYLKEIENNLKQTIHLINDIENQLSNQQRWSNIINTRGHLIWCIKDFTKKLEEAKQYDTILHSAMFSNKPFGYNLRLDIYLNGRGTWKGRNMLACLNVIMGEYDPILDWPCRLQAYIIIRDQFAFDNHNQDYVKLVNVKKKTDDQLQTQQFFHISHKVLMQEHYLRNDCIFVEVKILKS